VALVVAAFVEHRAAAQLVPYIAAGSSGTAQTLVGIPADRLCVDQRTALDGADMLLEPTAHSIHCMVDVISCIRSGFCLMQSAVNPAAGNRREWHCAYNFSSAATSVLVSWLSPQNGGRMRSMDIRGTWQADGSFVIDGAALAWSGATPVPTPAPTPPPATSPTGTHPPPSLPPTPAPSAASGISVTLAFTVSLALLLF